MVKGGSVAGSSGWYVVSIGVTKGGSEGTIGGSVDIIGGSVVGSSGGYVVSIGVTKGGSEGTKGGSVDIIGGSEGTIGGCGGSVGGSIGPKGGKMISNLNVIITYLLMWKSIEWIY